MGARKLYYRDASCVMPESTLQSGRWRSAQDESRGGGEDGPVGDNSIVGDIASLSNEINGVAGGNESDGSTNGIYRAESSESNGEMDGNYGAGEGNSDGGTDGNRGAGGGDGDGDMDGNYGAGGGDGDMDGNYGAGGGDGDGDMDGKGGDSDGDMDGNYGAGGGDSDGDMDGNYGAGGGDSDGDMDGNYGAGGGDSDGDMDGNYRAGGGGSDGDMDGNYGAGGGDSDGDMDGNYGAGGGDSDGDMDGNYGAGGGSNGNAQLKQPLYSNAPVSVEESVYATYLYVVKNKLSYQATTQLLNLLQLHIPSPNLYPQSFHLLKKLVEESTKLKVKHYCSTCLDEVPQREQCSAASCSRSALSHFALLPFEEQLKDMFTGKCVS